MWCLLGVLAAIALMQAWYIRRLRREIACYQSTWVYIEEIQSLSDEKQ